MNAILYPHLNLLIASAIFSFDKNVLTQFLFLAFQFIEKRLDGKILKFARDATVKIIWVLTF